jgi:hypothetical protein
VRSFDAAQQHREPVDSLSSARTSLQSDLRGGIAAEDGCVTNVASQHLKTCVSGVTLNVQRVHSRLDRRGCQPGPDGVPGELPGVEPKLDAAGNAAHFAWDDFIGADVSG